MLSAGLSASATATVCVAQRGSTAVRDGMSMLVAVAEGMCYPVGVRVGVGTGAGGGPAKALHRASASPRRTLYRCPMCGFAFR